MRQHKIRNFIVRQQGFKDTMITFIGHNGWWISALNFDHEYTTHSIGLKMDEPTRADVYKAWAREASAIQLGSNGNKKPYIMRNRENR